MKEGEGHIQERRWYPRGGDFQKQEDCGEDFQKLEEKLQFIGGDKSQPRLILSCGVVRVICVHYRKEWEKSEDG